MTDDRPVDVRLAEALGWTSLDYDADRNLWEGWNPDKGLPDWPRYSTNYAWCGEVAHLNRLESRWSLVCDGLLIVSKAVGRQLRLVDWLDAEGLGFCAAICEWVIAAVAAGVRVVLPGGRVIEGRAA